MTQVNPKLRGDIAQTVQKALDRHQPRSYRVAVDLDAILEDDGWYHVVVKSDDDRRDRDFYDALASAEEDLNDKLDGHQILLVPVIAE
jgi:hypothetical protein